MAWQDRAYNREEGGGVPPVVFRFPKITPLAMALIGTCLVAFFVQSFTRNPFSPLEVWGGLRFGGGLAFIQPWRWITYQYLHANTSHFFFNMIGLYFFLPSLEMLWGWRKAFAFYTAGGIVAGVVYGLLTLATGVQGTIGLIGASGSIFAALGAVALLMPERQLILLFFPLPIRVAAGLFGAFFLLAVVADHDYSSAAHLGGLAFGFIAPWVGGPVIAKKRRQLQQWSAKRSADADREEFEAVDRILQKVHNQGMNSLSRSERKLLKNATERQRQADLKRASRAR
jgi:membrane associated rhomboid family serine protease